MRILDRYIGRTIFSATFLSLFVLIGLSAIIKFVEQVKRVGEGNYDILDAAYFVLLKTPIEITLFFPMAALLGALIGLGSLASSSELVVIQSAGISKFRIAISVIKTALPMVIIIMLLGEFIVPTVDKEAYYMRDVESRGAQSVNNEYNIWAKDSDAMVSIGRMNSKAELFNVSLYFFDKNQELTKALSARKGNYQGDSWLLTNVTQTEFLKNKTLTAKIKSFRWETGLNPEKIEVILSDPDTMSMRDIYNYINYLQENSQDASRYELVFWRKTLLPFTVVVMMLLSVSFIFGGLRSVSMGTRLLFGITSGFAFYVAGELFGPFSLVFHLPPLLGALLPSLIVFVIAMYLLRKQT